MGTIYIKFPSNWSPRHCVKCGAKPMERCSTPLGKYIAGLHSERISCPRCKRGRVDLYCECGWSYRCKEGKP